MATIPSVRSSFTGAPFDPFALDALRTALQGVALTPGDDGYADASACWSVLIRHEPAIVVMAETTDDVILAVRFANAHDLPIAVQGTGHGQPAPCVGGMLVNTSRMQGVTIFPQARRARAEAGVKWESVVPLAHEHGLAPLAGSTTDVGVVGYTLGGGHGWLARKYGRAADMILAADIVTAKGELLHVTEESEPALFRALKGGSGNYGIVTELEFGLVPVETVYGGSVMYPLADASCVFTAFNAWSAAQPEDITASIGIMRFPPVPFVPEPLQGQAVVFVRACAVGNLERGEAAIAEMRSLGTPLFDTFATMPFTEIDAISMDPKDPMPAMSGTMILSELDAATIDAVLEQVGPGAETPLLMVEMRDYRSLPEVGGLSLFALGIPFAPEAGMAIEGAITGLRHALAPHVSDRVLLNFLGDGDVGEERTRAAFGETEYLWRQDMKRRYDPQNRFRFNHNIAPLKISVIEG